MTDYLVVFPMPTVMGTAPMRAKVQAYNHSDALREVLSWFNLDETDIDEAMVRPMR